MTWSCVTGAVRRQHGHGGPNEAVGKILKLIGSFQFNADICVQEADFLFGEKTNHLHIL